MVAPLGMNTVVTHTSYNLLHLFPHKWTRNANKSRFVPVLMTRWFSLSKAFCRCGCQVVLRRRSCLHQSVKRCGTCPVCGVIFELLYSTTIAAPSVLIRILPLPCNSRLCSPSLQHSRLYPLFPLVHHRQITNSCISVLRLLETDKRR